MTDARDLTPPRTDPAGTAPVDRGSRAARLGVILLLGLVVAWFTWDAVGNLIALPELLTDLGLAESVPWPALVLGVAMPVVYYAAAVVIGVRLSLARLTLVLIASLAAIAATRLSLIAVATGTLVVL
ncbi:MULTISPECIES: hypothetical protein [Microcella]|uniref:hypothetical protein n=1 Tax=Microcella TaxID=337004 RepID=UPI0015CF100E|nr:MULTISPECIES: hypothetical protein [Microcella]QOD94319.1 hypothetical protein IE160_03590 [Chryseoglobus sp. 28M-23]